jgi:hypothetical protein
MAFLSWLQKLGYALNTIAPAMVTLGTKGTLAQLYAKLTSGPAAEAWPKFLSAAKALPQIVSDDPFGMASIACRAVLSRKGSQRIKTAAKPQARKKTPHHRKR